MSVPVTLVQGAYNVAGLAFILALAGLSRHDTARAGNRFGVAMHDVFERCDFAAWRNWRPGQPAPEGQAAAILEALQRGGYAQDELDDGLAMLTRLVGHTSP